MRTGWFVGCVLLCGEMLCSGCVPTLPPGDGGGSGLPGSSITPRKLWRASGDLRDPAHAIDADLATAAVSGSSYVNARIDVDLGKPCLFNRIIVEHGAEEYGFPYRMAVFTSLDGQYFAPLTQVPGKRRVTNVALISPVLARYVRLQAISPGPRPWSVAEIGFQ